MYDKWNVRNEKKKGCLKIHIAVNTKTKDVLALEVIDEKVHGGKVMCKLVDHVLKQNNVTDAADMRQMSKQWKMAHMTVQGFQISSKENGSAGNQGKEELHHLLQKQQDEEQRLDSKLKIFPD